MDTAGRAFGASLALAVGLLGCEPVNQTEVPNRVPYVVLAMLHTPEGVIVYHDVNASLQCQSWSCRPNPESCGYEPPPPPICLDAGVIPPAAAAPPDAALPDAALPDAALPDAALPDAALPDAALPDAALPDAALPDAGAPVPASMALTECISAEEAFAWPNGPYNPYAVDPDIFFPDFGSEPDCYEDAPPELCECVGGRIITADDGVQLVMNELAPIGASSFHAQSPVDGWIEVTDTWSVKVGKNRYIVHHAGAFELDLPDGVEVRSGLFYPSREK